MSLKVSYLEITQFVQKNATKNADTVFNRHASREWI